jgi:uncharacterized repeat protein (TIGR03803 family)
LLINSDGASPCAVLALVGGNLYGTTAAGGASANGTVFSVSTSGPEFRTIHAFPVVDSATWTNFDGAQPVAGVLPVGNSLYGTTFSGCPGGAGMVFNITIPYPPAVITTIVHNPDGSATFYFLGGPNSTNIIQATVSLTSPVTWQNVSTNVAGAGGAWHLSKTAPPTPRSFIAPMHHKIIKNKILVFALMLWCAQMKLDAGPDHWVTTWGCGPQLTEPRNLPPVPLANSTLRQFVHVTVGGNDLRVRFSNAYGTNPVTMNSVHAALASGTGSAANGVINPATDQALTFHGASSVSIPAGAVVYSDPFNFNLPALTNLAVSIYFGDISATTINGHPGSRTTSYIRSGNVVSAASMSPASTTVHWYIITGVEVLADASSRTLITFGDSITDGRGSDTDGNDRWPDDLARLLNANTPTTSVAVVNMGIGGGGVYGGLGPAGLNRFDRDVPNQSGARWFICFIGVNDIGGGTSSSNLISAYSQWASKAHARGMLAYGATITPFGGNGYYTTAHEATRQAVNAWFRTNTLYDAVIDFDAAVRDPVTLTNLQAAYNSGDGLHLNPPGYRTMAGSINLNLFTR